MTCSSSHFVTASSVNGKGGSVKASILVVDDQPDTAELLCDLLGRRGFHADAVTSGAACLEHLQTHPAEVVITDIQMPDMTGIELCATLRERFPALLPIVLTGRGDVDTVVAAIRAGAYDFITKPVKIDAVEIAVTRALQVLHLKQEVTRLRASGVRDPAAGIVGDSPPMRDMIEMIHRVAGSDASVLITGESGTGKELVARALHDLSPRRDEPFVAVNCAAMPPALLESELFGHVRGAFTDAKHDRKGLFVMAGAGTILLDEIGELPIEMQVKLLRVLQQRTVRPVGGDDEIPFEARVLTSTNRDLDDETAAKRFRADLYYRINVVQVTVPPLRDRGGDVLALAQHFIDEIARRTNKPVRGISASAAQQLVDHDWPGNVRELENCMERAVALCRHDEITADDLPTRVRARERSCVDVVLPDELITIGEMEQRYIRQVLAVANGNKSRAARILGLDRRSLYRRLEGSAATSPPPEQVST